MYLKYIFGILILCFASQSALTFSRTGLYLAGCSLTVLIFYLLKGNRGNRKLQAVRALVVIFGITYFFLVPKLDNFTAGNITKRFENTNLTHRDELAMVDLRIWSDNFLIGIGPGMGRDLRGEYGRRGAAHTELTRLVSEHGVLGLMSLAFLLGIILTSMNRQKQHWTRAFMASIFTWSALFLCVSAMRLVAPSFLLGLISVTLAPLYQRKRPSRLFKGNVI